MNCRNICPASEPRHVTQSTPTLRDVFTHMLQVMGPSHWWPAETRFEIMVGAVLTQNTAWGNVARSLDQLRVADALNPHVLRSMDNTRLQALIRPSGFQQNKSRSLQSLCDWFGSRYEYDPERASGRSDDELRSELLQLFGIGGETADDMLLYVFDRRVFIADTYARRLCTFLGFDVAKGYEAFRSQMMPLIEADSLTLEELQEFHGLIDEFGKSHRSVETMQSSFLTSMSGHAAV